MSLLRCVWCWVLGVKPDGDEAAPAVIEPIVVPARLAWPVPDAVWKRLEDLRLARVVVLVEEGCTPWSAASSVFGGAGVAREASQAGLSGSLAGVRRDSVPR